MWVLLSVLSLLCPFDICLKGKLVTRWGRDLSNCFFYLQERVGNFLADFYSVNGLVLESRKRREHLSEEDILRNKAIMESLSKGGNLIEQNFEVSRASYPVGCSLIPLGRAVSKRRDSTRESCLRPQASAILACVFSACTL